MTANATTTSAIIAIDLSEAITVILTAIALTVVEGYNKHFYLVITIVGQFSFLCD